MVSLTPQMLALLCGLGLLPILAVGVLVFLPRSPAPTDKFISGNPLFDSHTLPVKGKLFLQPLTHSLRTMGDRELHDIVLGLRHLSLPLCAPALKQALLRTDPEIQIYAQSILQEKQQHLQSTFARLSANDASSDQAALANFLEAGLKLAESPLTQASEIPSTVLKMLPVLDAIVKSQANHPRLLATAIGLCLLCNKGREAELLLGRLPAGSPLLESLHLSVRHHQAIHHPSEPLTDRYQIR